MYEETVFLSEIRKHIISVKDSIYKEEVFAITYKGIFVGVVTKRHYHLSVPVTDKRKEKGDTIYTSRIEIADGEVHSFEETSYREILLRLLESHFEGEVLLK